MDNRFFEQPILNSPYQYPRQHWELDEHGQPTQRIVEAWRKAEFVTPIPQPKKRKAKIGQAEMVFDEGHGLSSEKQQYDPTPAVINELRQIEAVETVIWLTEGAPQLGKTGRRFPVHLANANDASNPDLPRLALKLATGAGKTTVMAMIIAWQTIHAMRQREGTKFTRGFELQRRPNQRAEHLYRWPHVVAPIGMECYSRSSSLK